MARQARLDAEIGEKPEIEFPAELRDNPADPDAARAMREEQLLFDSRRAGLAAQVIALGKNQDYLRGEIEEMRQKDATIEKQLTAMRKELDLVKGLLSKGLTGAPRQLELEQNIAQVENNELDVLVAIARNTEEISKADRDILDLKSNFRNAALLESEDVGVKLSETIEKMHTSQSLIMEAEVRAPGMLRASSSAYAKPIYVLSRRGGGDKAENVTAEESDLVQPGDIVRVLPRPTDGGAPGASTASSGPAN
jgi:polysaccharide biosynthesis/export protein ExoF